MEPKYHLILRRQKLKSLRMRRIWITSFFILIGFLGSLVYLVSPYSQAQNPFGEVSPVQVRVHPVRVTELLQEIGTDAEIQPSSLVHVTIPGSTARVATLHVDVGDYVGEGQPLVELDPAPLAAALRSAEEEVHRKKARLEEVKKAQAARREELAAEVRQAQNEAERAKANLEEVKKAQAARREELAAEVRQAQNEAERAKADLEEAKKAQATRRRAPVTALQRPEEAVNKVPPKGILRTSESASVESARNQEDAIKAENAPASSSAVNPSSLASAELRHKRALENAAKAQKALTNEDIFNRSELASAELARTQALEELAKVDNRLKNEEALNRAELASAEADYAAALAELTQIQQDLARVTVKAPVSGIVLERSVHPGEVLMKGEAPAHKLLTLGVIDPVLAVARVPLESLSSIYAGQEAGIVLEASQETTLEGTLVKVEKDPQTSDFKAYLKIPNPNLLLKPGVFPLAKFQNKRAAPAIPKIAIINQTDQSAVFVVNSDLIAHRRLIKVGLSRDGLTEVLSGLKEGEQVITVGQKFIKEGDKVKIVRDMPIALNK